MDEGSLSTPEILMIRTLVVATYAAPVLWIAAGVVHAYAFSTPRTVSPWLMHAATLAVLLLALVHLFSLLLVALGDGGRRWWTLIYVATVMLAAVAAANWRRFRTCRRREGA